MMTELEPRLDDFEQRLHELEDELAVLRSLAANGRVDAAPEAFVQETAVEEPLTWAYELLDRGDFRGLFRAVERSRRDALASNDLRTLLELSKVMWLAEAQAPIGVDGKARRLGYTIRQNARFVARALGVEVDEQALRAEALPGYEPETEPEPVPVVVPEPPRESPAAARELEHQPGFETMRERARAWEKAPEPAFVSAAPSAPRPPLFRLPELGNADLFGAKALAIAGGIVTLLGIIFFFVLAVNRGWIGPEGRVALGGAAALLVYGGGLELRRRYGETYSSLAAVAAGIAGGYGVLLAAAQLYHFVGHAGALVVAALIAGIGLGTALRWRSQMIAGLGLLGAILAPLAVAAQDGLSVLGTSFVAFMVVAAAVVAIRERWDKLLVVGALASLPQALALSMQAKYSGLAPGGVVSVAAVFAGITVGTGIARQLRGGGRDLRSLPVSFLFVGASFAVGCALRLYGSPDSRGFALIAIAIAFGVVAAALFRRTRDRDLSALAGALGLIVVGVAFGELMSGSPLAFAWAGEAATLAWLGRRVKDVRYQLFALLYLAAAVVHVLALDMTVRHLFKPLDISAGGALAVVAVGLASALVAWQTAPKTWGFASRRGFFRAFVPIYRSLGAAQRTIRLAGYWLAAAAAVYAMSLGILAAVPSFDWGHVAMYSFWSAIGAGMYGFGVRRPSEQIRFTGLIWLVITAIAAIANGQAELTPDPRAAACLVAGVALFAAALVELFVVVEARYARLPKEQRQVRLGAAWVSGIAAIAALSVGVVAAVPSYDWSRVAMFCMWSMIGLGVLALALARRAPHARAGALAGLVVTDAAAIWTGVALLGRDARATAGLVAGLALLAATLVELFVVIAPRYEQLKAEQRVPWLTAAWGMSVVAVAALSVGIVAAIPSYDWGRVCMFSMWSGLGLGILVAALRRQAPAIRAGALAGLAITAAAAFTTGEKALDATPRGTAFLVVGGALLLAAFADQLLARRRVLTLAGVGLVLVEAGLGLAAFAALLGGNIGSVDERGLAFLCLAGLHVLLALSMYRVGGQRDFSTLLWGSGLVLGYGASERLVPGTYHVLTLALAAGLLAWLAQRLADWRFLAAAGGCTVVGLATAVIRLAPPGHLFRPHEHPGAGALGVLFVAVAAAVVAAIAGDGSELRRRSRALGYWVSGILAVYGLSLLVLALFQASFSGSVDTNFHRGHTAVSAFWGLIGLALLYFGLTRLRALRVAGFATFAVSLVKIFVFDLPSLSSITRALSFLAVGVVLLAGGFFYQRLSAGQPVQPKRRREPVEWPACLGRIDLLVGLAAAAAMIVWFGTGSAPLGS